MIAFLIDFNKIKVCSLYLIFYQKYKIENKLTISDSIQTHLLKQGAHNMHKILSLNKVQSNEKGSQTLEIYLSTYKHKLKIINYSIWTSVHKRGWGSLNPAAVLNDLS